MKLVCRSRISITILKKRFRCLKCFSEYKQQFFLHGFWHLWLGEEYDCRQTGGGGTDGHMSYNFIVSPPLPDDISGLDLIFRETKTPFKRNSTDFEIVMHIE